MKKKLYHRGPQTGQTTTNPSHLSPTSGLLCPFALQSFTCVSFCFLLVSLLVGHSERLVSLLSFFVSGLVFLLVGHCVRLGSFLSPLLVGIVSVLSPFCLPFVSPLVSLFSPELETNVKDCILSSFVPGLVSLLVGHCVRLVSLLLLVSLLVGQGLRFVSLLVSLCLRSCFHCCWSLCPSCLPSVSFCFPSCLSSCWSLCPFLFWWPSYFPSCYIVSAVVSLFVSLLVSLLVGYWVRLVSLLSPFVSLVIVSALCPCCFPFYFFPCWSLRPPSVPAVSLCLQFYIPSYWSLYLPCVVLQQGGHPQKALRTPNTNLFGKLRNHLGDK